MSTLDFIVHRSWNYEHFSKSESYLNYLSAIDSVISSSKNYFLIESPWVIRSESPSFSGKFLRDTSFYIRGHYSYSGQVHKSSHSKLLDLLDSHDGDIKIHGAQLGECLEGFSTQLLSFLLYLKSDLKFEYSSDPLNRGSLLNVRKLAKEFARKNLYSDFGLSYGVVLKGFSPKANRIISPNRSFSYFKFGNPNYQLISNETKIFSKS